MAIRAPLSLAADQVAIRAASPPESMNVIAVKSTMSRSAHSSSAARAIRTRRRPVLPTSSPVTVTTRVRASMVSCATCIPAERLDACDPGGGSDIRRGSAAPHQASYGRHELVGHLDPLAVLGADDAVAGVLVEQAECDLVERGLHRADLGQHVDAVAVLLDHPLHAAHLALDAVEALQQLIL